MRYVCLTCDYDGTIARNGKVAQSTLQALEKTRSSGRKIILATGRELDDLLSAFPEVSLFDRVVAENGGLLIGRQRGNKSFLPSRLHRSLSRNLPAEVCNLFPPDVARLPLGIRTRPQYSK